MVTGWSMFSGNTGYISLGHAVFFGSGAYTVALLRLAPAADRRRRSSPRCRSAALVAAAVAVPFGLVALRVRRHTFVVVTIAMFFIFQLLAFNLAFTQGNQRRVRAVPAVESGHLQQPLLLRGAHHRGAAIACPG